MTDIPETPVPEPEDDLMQVRQLILASHPDTVPELVTGTTIADLIASIAPAQAAYTRVVESIPQAAVTVPAGGNTPVLVEADALPTSEKIRRGLAARRP
jgi:hypothetical protein